jgi:Zn-dependent protease with chaperone function
MRDSQRAEYAADAIAARVAGAAAVVEVHERTLLHTTFFAEVQHSMREGAEGLLERALDRIVSVPQREVERRRRVSRLQSTRLESTHPPTSLRIALLEARPGAEPLVRLTAERSAAIDEELRPRRSTAEQTIVDEHRARLYY